MTAVASNEARMLLRHGIYPVPIPRGEKAPRLKRWQTLRITPDTVERYFNGDTNVGVLLGEPSGGLVDIDLDCAEAITLAPLLLPNTGWVFGRRSVAVGTAELPRGREVRWMSAANRTAQQTIRVAMLLYRERFVRARHHRRHVRFDGRR